MTRILKTFRWACALGIVCLIAAAVVMPDNTTKVTAHSLGGDTAPMTTRTLAPRATTTTFVGPENPADIIVIDSGVVTHINRATIAAQIVRYAESLAIR